MKHTIVVMLLLFPMALLAQWTNTGNNSATGSLAIGYNGTPVYDLDISKPTELFLRIHNQNYSFNPAALERKGGIIFTQGGIDKTAAIQFAVPPNYHVPGILFSTKSAWNLPGSSATSWYDRMFIHPNGFVGIGTVSPAALLTVEDAATSTGKPNVALRVATPNTTLDQKSGAAIEFASAITVSKIAGIDERQSVNGEYRGALSFVTRYGVGGSDVGFVERMRINAFGYVGIGTSTPGSKLDIKENLGADALRILDANGDPRISIGQEPNWAATTSIRPMSISRSRHSRTRALAGISCFIQVLEVRARSCA